MNKPKAIIFDWDNTLIDSWPMIHSAIDETMVKMGKEPWGLSKVKKNVHKSMRESFPAIFGDNWQEAGQIYKDSYIKNHLQNLVMISGSMELLELAKNLGIKLFVVSNKMGPTLRKEAKHLGIEDKFFNLIGAGDAIYDKPSKEPVHLTLEGSDIDLSNNLTWFVGDSYVDIECAINSGCQPVLYNKENNLSRDLIRRIAEDSGRELLHFDCHYKIADYLR